MSKNEVMEQNQGDMPEFLKNKEAKGHEDVDGSDKIQEYRVATKMSTIVDDTEADVSRGEIYNVNTKESLGEERKLLIFKKRVTHQLSSEEGGAILCKSYDRKEGNIRTYHDTEDFDEDVIAEFELEKEQVENEERGLTHSCQGCEFHPTEGWKTVDGQAIPPRCNEAHEMFVLDLTEGVNKVPYLIRITDKSRIKSKLVKRLDNLISHKLKFQGTSIFAGVFNFSTKLEENSRGNKFYVWDVDFEGYVEDEGLYNFAEMMHDEFNEREEDYNTANDGQPETNMEEQEEGWGDDEEEEEVPF